MDNREGSLRSHCPTRGLAAVGCSLLLLTVVACGDDASPELASSGTAPSTTVTTTTTATTTSTTAPPTTAPVVDIDSLVPTAPAGEAPGTWFAVEHRDDRFVLVRGSTDGGELEDLGSRPDDFGAPETFLPVSATDVAITDDGSAAFVAFCCEPVSGSIYRFPTSGGSVEPESFDQGNDLDISGDRYVRSDTIGVLRWTLGEPAATADETLVDAHALDIAAVRGDAAGVAALTGDDGSVLRTYGLDATAMDEIALSGPHCLLTGTSDGLVAMAGGVRVSEHGSTCQSDRFTVITPEGAIGGLQLSAALQDLETDSTGDHVIGVDEEGNVVHVAPGDEMRPLTEGRRFVAADW